MKPHHHLAALALSVALGGAGCAPYASVSSVRPHFNAVDSKLEKRAPLESIGAFLTAAQAAQQHLARDPGNIAARDAYNFAVARVIGTVQQARLDPWTHPLRVPGAAGDFVLSHQPAADPLQNPALYDLTPADQLEIKGTYVQERQRKEGIGAPVVAIERDANKHAREDFLMPKLCDGVTALIRFERRRAVISFEDPLATERVAFSGHRFPLAADLTAPVAMMLAQKNPRNQEIPGLLRPDDGIGTARLVRTQPYDPNKTVVLIIHGLKDTPATWVPMLNRLQADAELRRNYQVWLFGYPSGYPYPHSAAILRRELDAMGRRFPLRKKMVVIGHSMGGCISRLLITDTGDKLWRGIFLTPPEKTPLPASSKAQLREELVFQHRPEISRVIFIAAPLRGSELARTWIGRIASKLVKLPSSALDTGNDAVRAVTFDQNELRINHAPKQCGLSHPRQPLRANPSDHPAHPRHSAPRHLRRPRQRRSQGQKHDP